MNKEKTYSEKLKDPRWVKLRKKVIERDNHICQLCYEEGALQVHHSQGYRVGLEPWEYELEELITLCPACHSRISDGIKRAQELIWEMAQNVNQIESLVILMEEVKNISPLLREKIADMVCWFNKTNQYRINLREEEEYGRIL